MFIKYEMITSKRAKVLLAIVFFIVGYTSISFTMFVGLQVDTKYGTIAIVAAALVVMFLVRIYHKIVK